MGVLVVETLEYEQARKKRKLNVIFKHLIKVLREFGQFRTDKRCFSGVHFILKPYLKSVGDLCTVKVAYKRFVGYVRKAVYSFSSKVYKRNRMLYETR